MFNVNELKWIGVALAHLMPNLEKSQDVLDVSELRRKVMEQEKQFSPVATQEIVDLATAESYTRHQIDQAGFTIRGRKGISYGIAFNIGHDGMTSTVNVYYSKKKGMSVVIGGSESELTKQLAQMFKDFR